MAEEWSYPESNYYDRKHGWLSVQGTLATQGLTPFGQRLAGRILFVEIPRLGRQVRQGENLLSLESGKWVGRLPAMISGRIAEVNQELEDTPALINDFPYSFGWLVRIEMENPDELNHLMRAGTKELQEFLEAEKERFKE